MIAYFKSVLEQDVEPIVLCDTDHKMLYMNPAACVFYQVNGGEKLLGRNVLDCHGDYGRERILQVLEWFRKDAANNRVHTMYSRELDKDVYVVALRDEQGNLIGYYEKLECRTRDMTPAYEV